MGSQNYESFDIPAVGEIRAREGTATHELAGAVKFWHDKYKSARLDGFIAGISLLAMSEILITAIYYLIH